MRMQRLILGLFLTVLLAVSSFADTVYLRNGSVIQGSFLRFENGEIFIQLTGGGDRDRGRVLRFQIKEVLRIVTDRDPDGTISNATAANTSARPLARTNYESFPAVNVPLSYDWINSNIQVTQGQRIRIEATGTVTLDGRDNSSPSGLNRRDSNAPLPDEADGALIASIGNDISIPILMIGKAKEFVADRDGMLYFSVNHYDINNTRGSYSVAVTTERRGGGYNNQNPRAQTPVAPVSPFKCGLPIRFRGNENDYTTIWTRIGNTNEYNAEWSNGIRKVTGVISVTTEANRISFRRTSSTDGVAATYEGTVGADGVSINGRVSYPGTSGAFSVTAECY